MELETVNNFSDVIVYLLSDEMEVCFPFGNLEVTILSVAKDPIDPGMYYVEHCHDSFELRIVEHGTGHMNISGMDITVSENDMYLVGPRIMHRRRSDNLDPLMEYCVKFNLRLLDAAVSTPEEGRLLDILSNPYPYVFSTTEDIRAVWHELLRYLLKKPDCYMVHAKIAFLHLLAKTHHCILAYRKNGDDPANSPLHLPMQDLRIRRIVEFVEINLNKNIQIQTLARLLNLSPRQINRIVKQYFGMTFRAYLDNHRLNIAKELLIQTDRSVSDIAFMAGFTAPQQMYRLFKTKLCCSPRQFRSV